MTNPKKDSFIIYRSFIEAINDLPDKNRLEVYDAISLFALEEKEPNLTGISKTIFTLIKPQLQANHKKFVNGCKGSEYGKLGGRPKNNNPKETPKKPLDNPKETPNVNDNVNDNVNEECKLMNENKNNKEKEIKKSKGFIAPTLQEVKDYCQERKNDVNAEKWLNFYEAKGWLIGKNKMKDWKAAVRTWEGSNQPKRNITL